MPVYKFPPKTQRARKTQVAMILWSLWLEGPAYCPSGLATDMIRERLAREGFEVSNGNLNSILRKMEGDDYGHLITREVIGRRTFKIEAAFEQGAPGKAYPPNPFRGQTDTKAKRTARFSPATGVVPPPPVFDEDPIEADDLAETFARQAAFEAVSFSEPEPAPEPEPEPAPEPEPEPELEPDVIAEPEPELEPDVYLGGAAEPLAGAGHETPSELVPSPELGPYLSSSHTNGTHDPVTVGGSADLLTAAIGLISRAMTLRHQEDVARQEAEVFDVDKRIDQRLAAYVTLMERNAHLESQLRRSQERERELIGLVRTLQGTIENRQVQM